jgi:hypothetical protein
MASGHRKRKAAAVRANILTPAGYTNVNEADRGILATQNAIVNSALYGNGGTSPTFTAGATSLLSDAVSNADGAWTAAGLTGETTNAGPFVYNLQLTASGLLPSSGHYYFPAIGTQTVLSGAGGVNPPIIVYTNDGPQASYIPFYEGGTAATASIKLGSQITGSSGVPTHVVFYIGGTLSANDQIRILGVNNGTVLEASGVSPVFAQGNTKATSSAAEMLANSGKKIFVVKTGSIAAAGGAIVEFSSSTKTSTTPVAGAWIVISTGSYQQ